MYTQLLGCPPRQYSVAYVIQTVQGVPIVSSVPNCTVHFSCIQFHSLIHAYMYVNDALQFYFYS